MPSDIGNISDSINYDDLTLEKRLGEGGFGRVFKGDYIGTEVAIKECFHEVADSEELPPDWDFHKYIMREVDSLRGARHPNIVQFMGVCSHEDTMFIVTEFVPGGNLKEWILNEEEKEAVDAKDSIESLKSLRLRISFAIDVARALAYLHAHNMVHRDLKLENLLLTENNRVKVCDFGFSRLQPAPVSPSSSNKGRHDRKLSYCGTEDYMAPELILCMDYTNTIDNFSFGIVLLSLVLLTPPLTNAFRRVIPGFGLDMELIETDLPANFPEQKKFMQLIGGLCHEDGDKRVGWKETLAVLKQIEASLIKSIKEKIDAPKMESHVELNVGLPALHGSQSDLALDSVSGSMELTTESTGESKSSHLFTKSVTIPRAGPTPAAGHSNSNYTYGSSSNGGNNAHVRMRHDVPHRFSLVSSLNIGSPIKCQACNKNINGVVAKYLVCDDCGFICHKKCAANVAPICGFNMAMFGTFSAPNTELGNLRKSLMNLAGELQE